MSNFEKDIDHLQNHSSTSNTFEDEPDLFADQSIADFEKDSDHYKNIFSTSDTSEDESDLSTDQSKNCVTLNDELLLFFLKFNIPVSAMEYLLKLLRRHGAEVSNSVHLLKKNAPKYGSEIEYLPDGKFVYFGVKENIDFCLEKQLLSASQSAASHAMSNEMQLDILVNCDGLPLYKSSCLGLWPILIIINGTIGPLVVAVFLGHGKPNIKNYLQKFVEELKLFHSTGVVCGNKSVVKIKQLPFTCDAPANVLFVKL